MADKVDPEAMELPAPFVNQFQVLVAGANVRISFAEGFAGQPSNYRSAVVMSIADARELALAVFGNIPSPPNAFSGLEGALDNPFLSTQNALAALTRVAKKDAPGN